ncbi:MAG: hypothetical protein LBJ24_08905 [Treponema sp.]|jgi:hypothetical protein|nr:hypothetical protein [Treponema sp.]
MAIQPIDLQTLFTQVEKVGKSQAAQKEGLQIHQTLQGIQTQQKTEERIQSVNESQDMGDGAEAVKNRSPRKGGEQEQGREGAEEKTAEEQPESRVIQDPALGKIIDVSG